MERVVFEVEGELGVAARYALLSRLYEASLRRGVEVMGFAIDRDVRLLLRGRPSCITDAVRFTKMGTVQSHARRARHLVLGPTRRDPVWDPYRALVQLHRTDGCPLGSPWTSHRDLLGYRRARFYDPGVWALDARWIHIQAGGDALPVRAVVEKRPLDELLRVAGAVLGVLPANRSCFGLFAQLASRLGHRSGDIADALMLTPRRIRQLRARPHPMVDTALICAGDPRWR